MPPSSDSDNSIAALAGNDEKRDVEEVKIEPPEQAIISVTGLAVVEVPTRRFRIKDSYWVSRSDLESLTRLSSDVELSLAFTTAALGVALSFAATLATCVEGPKAHPVLLAVMLAGFGIAVFTGISFVRARRAFPGKLDFIMKEQKWGACAEVESKK
jgi:hypothetical protein